MDFFEEKERENKEKELYKATFERNVGITRLVLPLVFGGIGLLLLVLGVILFFNVDNLPGYILMGLGGTYIFLALLIFFILSKVNIDKAYDRYQRRVKLGKPIYNTYEMSLRIVMLEKKVKELEEEIDSLRRNR